MSVDHDLAALADLCGILPEFYDLQGQQRITSPDTQRALLAASGIDVSDDGAIRASLTALRAEQEDRWFPHEVIVDSNAQTDLGFGLGATWTLRTDGQDDVLFDGAPADFITLPPLPSGVYVLTAKASGRTEHVTVLAAPQRLPSLHDVIGKDRAWGLTFALYGVQSARNTGLGDFEDLAQMGQIAGGQGAAFLGTNPLHNMGYNDRDSISPYSPSHRGFLNTSYIALDAIPGLTETPQASAFSAEKTADLIAYKDHKTAHSAALETCFTAFLNQGDPAAQTAFERFKSQAGEGDLTFARFEALGEINGANWRGWPQDIDEPPANRIDFHLWLQWVANQQLADAQARARAAGMPLGLYLDLAVGPRRDGAESWCERDAIAEGVSIGAPPDHLSPGGQNWGLAAFSPRKLAALNYAPLRRILAHTMRHAGIIRIDHVLGLNRSFWIPDNGSPGAYIRQSFDSLLAIIKIEAERHNCIVIGEDLGLVPEGFRDTMQSHGFYGYSVLQYEKDDHGTFRDPRHGPAQVLSCFATHDTPTLRGFEAGRDIDWWHKLGWIDAQAAELIHHQRAADVGALAQDGPFATRVHESLAQSSAGLVAVQLDDILDAVEAQNLPGTIDEHPNWRRKYQTTLDDLATDTRLHNIAALMRKAGRASDA